MGTIIDTQCITFERSLASTIETGQAVLFSINDRNRPNSDMTCVQREKHYHYMAMKQGYKQSRQQNIEFFIQVNLLQRHSLVPDTSEMKTTRW